MDGNLWEIAAYGDFLDNQSPVLKPLHIQTEQPEHFEKSPFFLSQIFLCKLYNISTKRSGRLEEAKRGNVLDARPEYTLAIEF